ncbi:hypothetical protein HOS16_gp71 [Shigella phage vB_SflS-ISF001]|uniref:Uncharacterized protein n=1 Tax=Shigella phage vB_SflS-ISF001 TaxID=2048005 RepID=A0A2D1GQ27_9CAUD|nr:hypothetical protein HOS16_gp71 [Shigella phage vB_SflS-ISF001]ATN94149.1 hypothetical protein FLXISF001_071 [Shigella phage vB_SflS-ISF001]
MIVYIVMGGETYEGQYRDTVHVDFKKAKQYTNRNKQQIRGGFSMYDLTTNVVKEITE